MSDPDEDTSLIEGQDEGGGTMPAVAEPPRDDGLVEEIDEQEHKGWLNEPTTG
jgi:hypothetical protein